MAEHTLRRPVPPPRRARQVLDLIAFFKFVKAAALVASGGATLGLLSPHVQDWAEDLLERLALRHASQLIGHLAARGAALLGAVEPKRLILVAVGAFLYAALFVVEGVGLVRGRRWAEYLTVIATGVWLPFEAAAVIRRATLPRAAPLVANAAVVLYLIWRLYEDRATMHEPA